MAPIKFIRKETITMGSQIRVITICHSGTCSQKCCENCLLRRLAIVRSRTSLEFKRWIQTSKQWALRLRSPHLAILQKRLFGLFEMHEQLFKLTRRWSTEFLPVKTRNLPFVTYGLSQEFSLPNSLSKCF